MRLLLDSHTLIWALDNPNRLSIQAVSALRDPANDVLVSAASVWELAIKVGLGKLALSAPYRQWTAKALSDLDAVILPITVDYADAQSRLPNHHRDPFDRMLIAQSQVEGISLVSNEPMFDRYGVSRIW
ncbi:MAG: type II toxin-antitoxin system VapC family toxin [Pirellulales bacterium]